MFGISIRALIRRFEVPNLGIPYCDRCFHVQSNKKVKFTCVNRRSRRSAFSVMASEGQEQRLKPQNFDYFLVLDFEATCEKDGQIKPQEIIEFPVLMINSRTLKMDAQFHQYVQPRVHRELTAFCTELTGIAQDMVDGQPFIEDVLKSFDKWMQENNLLDPSVKSLFVTCGDWDLNKMLPSQASAFNLHTPGYFNQWLNIKKAYAEVMSSYPRGMMDMLEGLHIQHQGRHHSGIDDCTNIAEILRQLLLRGYVAKATGHR